MKKLTNKVVLVTGGTTGIGLAAVRLFAAEGAKVTVTGTNPQTLEVARKELAGIAEVVASDASSGDDVVALAKRFPDGVDTVFVNAGVARLAPLAELDEKAFDDTFRINVRGPWLLLRYFTRIVRRGGSFVFNTSVNGILGMPGTSAYGPSKAALRSLVRVAAAELAPSGIRVNAVSPGPVETPLYGKLGLDAEAMKERANELISKIPMHRFGHPDEIAQVALFLASDAASFMTGEEITVDGGMTRV